MNGIGSHQRQRTIVISSGMGLLGAGSLPASSAAHPADGWELARVSLLSDPSGPSPFPPAVDSSGSLPEDRTDARPSACRTTGTRRRQPSGRGEPPHPAHPVSPRSHRRRNRPAETSPDLSASPSNPDCEADRGSARGRGRPRLVPAATVRVIVLLVRGGESLQGVANLLNAAGVPTPAETNLPAEQRTSRWSKYMVRNVLTTQHGRRLAAALRRLWPGRLPDRE